jgi:HK97 family phage portal protein
MKLPLLPYAPVRDVKAHSDDRVDPRALMVGTGYHSRISGKGTARYMSAYGGDNAVDWAMDCVRLIMESASGAAYYFQTKDGGKLLPHSERTNADSTLEHAPDDLAYIFEHPTPYMDYVELVELTIIDLLFAGEFFWWAFKPGGSPKPLALWRLHPANVDVIPGKTDFIAGYELSVEGQPQPIQIPRDQIVHVKLPNPHDPYRGLSVIAGGARAIDIELALTETQATFFEQGTHLGGVLQSERRVPDPVFQKIKRQFDALYSGRRNAGKVAVLEAGLKFQAVQSSAREAQFDALTKLSRDRIAHMFRVPLPLIGNMENANYKMAEAQRIFDTKTMRPLLNRIQRGISAFLTHPYWDLDFVIDYEYVMPDEDRLKLAESVAALPGIKVKEIRAQAGLEPLGDERDDLVLNLPVEGEPSRNLSGQAGRPPNGENVPAFDEPLRVPNLAADSARPRPVLTNGQKTASAASLPENWTWTKSANGTYALTVVTPNPPQVRPDIKTDDPLVEARTISVDRNATTIKRSLSAAATDLFEDLAAEFADPDVKATKKPDRTSSWPARIEGSPAWSRFIRRVEEIARRAINRAHEDATAQYAILGIQTSPERETELRAAALALADRETGIKSITGTLRERVLREVREGVRRGYSAEQVVNGVEGEGFAGLKGLFSAWRNGQAETIAITEATAYYNGATVNAAEAAGYSSFLVIDGQDDDQPCIDAHGQVWDAATAAANLYEHPRCRRAFIPVVAPVT